MTNLQQLIERRQGEVIENVRSDKSSVYQKTIADKKLLLLKCFDLYEAGKNRDEQRYFDLRTTVLEIIYSIQEDTIHPLITQTATEAYRQALEDVLAGLPVERELWAVDDNGDKIFLLECKYHNSALQTVRSQIEELLGKI
jgi:hypothetical protein